MKAIIKEYEMAFEKMAYQLWWDALKLVFQKLKDQLLARINNWSTCLLLQGGKETFIKSVLQTIPTYTIGCFLLPNSLCKDIEAIIAKYWWQKGHVSHVLKAKYYPNTTFMEVRFGYYLSLPWRSIWRAKWLLESETIWQIGNGSRIRI
ncbi:WW/Rsp5/WWP [Gossypium australe]|uniref:WW/Rsp5/WWP n=1 Tax=Gossypium australe TaxID=47621 RepID=A0A5B6W6Q1_9ROSI|nr:WW/Rsp5/WWP [Gossypium australe]